MKKTSANKTYIAIGTIVLAVIAILLVVFLLLRRGSEQTTGEAAKDSAQVLGLRHVADTTLPGGSSRLDYQSIDETTRRLFISHLGASSVTVFDLDNQKVVADIPGISDVHGVLAVPELHRVYASATGKNEIDIIDENNFQVVAQAPGGTYPDGIAYDPSHGKIFVSDESGKTVTVINVKTNQPVNTISLGSEVGNTQYDSSSQRIFSAAQSTNQLVTIDPRSETIMDRYDVPGCEGPHGLYINGSAHLAFAGCEGNATLVALDLQTKKVVSKQDVGDTPDVLAFDEGLSRLYVASESGIVSAFKVRGQDLERIGQAYLGQDAHTIAVDPNTHRVYLPLENVEGNPVLRIFEPVENQ